MPASRTSWPTASLAGLSSPSPFCSSLLSRAALLKESSSSANTASSSAASERVRSKRFFLANEPDRSVQQRYGKGTERVLKDLHITAVWHLGAGRITQRRGRQVVRTAVVRRWCLRSVHAETWTSGSPAAAVLAICGGCRVHQLAWLAGALWGGAGGRPVVVFFLLFAS